MSNQLDNHYKDCDPCETIEKIKSLIADLGLETEEIWKDDDRVIKTASVRINVKGTNIGTNGKGVNREYALASGYAEFMERFQNGILFQEDIFCKKKDVFSDQKIMTARELIKAENSFIQEYFVQKNMEDASLAQKEALLKKYEVYDKYYCGITEGYVSIPFYSCKKHCIEYLPKNIYSKVYGSNGMCAGNSKWEALIQGLSEIFERIAQKQVFLCKKPLPDIPEQYVKKIPYVYEMYSKLCEDKRFFVKLKDCSFGGKYPVAALVVIEKDTGRYGVRFGCFPNYGIALERTFTEATQGHDIASFASMNYIDLDNKFVDNQNNIMNSFKIGLAQYPYQFVCESSNENFNPWIEIKEETNEQMLRKWIEVILDEGYDVLIRDCSILGFPSYHIIIPGLSELVPMTVTQAQLNNTINYSVQKLQDIDSLTSMDCGYIGLMAKHVKNSILENNIHLYFPYAKSSIIPGEKIHCGIEHLALMCHLTRCEYDKALLYANRLYLACDEFNASKDERKEYYFYKMYCQYLLVNNGNHITTMLFMRKMFSKYLCDMMDELLCVSEKIMAKVYSNIDVDLNAIEEKRKLYEIYRNSALKSCIDQSNLLLSK